MPTELGALRDAASAHRLQLLVLDADADHARTRRVEDCADAIADLRLPAG